MFFFYIIGHLVMGWWYFDWWVWLIIGVSLFGALSSTFRFIAYRASDVPANPEVRYYSTQDTTTYVPRNDQLYSQPVTSSIPKEEINAKYCTYCGSNLEPGSQYCTNCGAPIQ
jgi:hypothetical protein